MKRSTRNEETPQPERPNKKAPIIPDTDQDKNDQDNEDPKKVREPGRNDPYIDEPETDGPGTERTNPDIKIFNRKNEHDKRK